MTRHTVTNVMMILVNSLKVLLTCKSQGDVLVVQGRTWNWATSVYSPTYTIPRTDTRCVKTLTRL